MILEYQHILFWGVAEPMPLKNFEERDGVIVCKKCGSTNVEVKALSQYTRLRYDIDTVYVCKECGNKEYC